MTFDELIVLLRNSESAEEINARREEIAQIIPTVRIMFDYDQQNYAHCYDLWMHCVHTVILLPRNLEDGMLYLAALLHDIGKPDCRVVGKREGDTNMHYYGHPKRSMEIVRDELIPYLLGSGTNLSEDDRRRLLYYVAWHDDRMSLRLHHLREHLRIPVSIEEFQKLMLLQVADAKAHAMIPIIEQRVEICEKLAGEYGLELYQRILQSKRMA